MRGKLLEVCDGVPIYAKVRPEDQDPLALVAGRRGRLEVGGQVYEVDRVGQGAAYLHRVYDPPVQRTFGPIAETANAAEKMLVVLAAIGNPDPEVDATDQECYDAAFKAAHLARQVRALEVSRGPSEPGISRSARFVERVQ